MKIKTLAATRIDTGLLTIAAVAFAGLMTIFVAGHAQSLALHDAAHDMRHATGMPCH